MKAKDPELFFHLGAERTGTKFVQFKVFPFFQNLCFINRNRYFKKGDIIAKGEHDKYLISYECNFKGEFESELKKIAKIYPNGKIILVLRSQHSWITSQYKRLVKNGRNAPFDKFLNVHSNDATYKPEQLYYFPKIALIEDLFETKPMIVLYEDFMKDPMGVIATIGNYIKTEYDPADIDLERKHTSYGSKQLKALKATMKYINIERKKVSSYGIINFLYRIYIDSIRYAVIYGSKILPDDWFDNDPLIPQSQMEEVKKFYENDWQKTKEYIIKNRLNSA